MHGRCVAALPPRHRRGAGHEVLGARLCPRPGKGREDFWSPRTLRPCTRPSSDPAQRSSPHTSGYLGRISPGSRHGLLVPFNVGSFLPVRRPASCLDSPEEAAVFIEQGRELCPLVLPNPHKAAAAEAGTELPPTRWKRGGGGRQSKPQADPKLPHPLQIAGGSSHLPRGLSGLLWPCPCSRSTQSAPAPPGRGALAEQRQRSHHTHTPPRNPPQTPAGLSRPPQPPPALAGLPCTSAQPLVLTHLAHPQGWGCSCRALQVSPGIWGP